MTVYQLTGEIDFTELAEAPNAFPVGYKHSKAWRHHKLGRITKDTSRTSLRHTAYAVFIIDETFGICKLKFIPPSSLHVNERTGRAHISFQTSFGPENVIIYALDVKSIQNTPDEIMELLHLNLIESAKP